MNLNKLIVALIDASVLDKLFEGNPHKKEMAQAVTDLLFWAHRTKRRIELSFSSFTITSYATYYGSLLHQESRHIYSYEEAESIRDQYLSLETRRLGYCTNPRYWI